MKAIWSVTVLIAAGASCVFAQQNATQEIVVTGNVFANEGTEIEVIGACRMQPGMKMACWTLDGRPNAALSKSATNGLRSGSSGQSQVRAGSPAVYAVYRYKRSPGQSRWIGTMPGAPIWLHTETWPGPKGQRYETETSMALVKVREGKAALVLSMNEPRARGFLTLKVGQSVTLGPETLRVVSVMPPKERGGVIDGLPVRTVVEVSGKAPAPIEAIRDEKGKWLGLARMLSNAMVPKRDSAWRVELTPNGIRILASVPPERLGSAEFSGSAIVHLVFPGIPLESVK